MLPEAELEYMSLPVKERFAMQSAFDKLIALGDRLAYPHSSAIQGSRAALRELRPAPATVRGVLSIEEWATKWS